MTNDRYEKVDFSLQTYLVQYTYMAHERLPLDPFKVKAPKTGTTNFQLIETFCPKNVVAPFENILWTVLSGMVIVVSFAFYIVHKGNLEIEERARIVGKVLILEVDWVLLEFDTVPLTECPSHRLPDISPLNDGEPGRRHMVWPLSEVVLRLHHIHCLVPDVIHHEHGLPEQPPGIPDLGRVRETHREDTGLHRPRRGCLSHCRLSFASKLERFAAQNP